MSHINEQIQVGAVFGRGKLIKPVWFIWKKKKYSLKEITYTWKSGERKTVLYHFSVTDGASLYHIAYNPERMIWKICAIEMEE